VARASALGRTSETSVEMSDGGNVSGVRNLLGASARPIANRPQVANLPHVNNIGSTRQASSARATSTHAV
jgi:hypothetical protein